MANRTNSSEYFWSYEYYWDYIDPIPVDGSKLKVNKYSIVIAFWVGLAAFVTFLFLILLYMSRSGSTPSEPLPMFANKHVFYSCQLPRLHTMEVKSVLHTEWEGTSCKPHLQKGVGSMVVKQMNTSSQSNSVSPDQIKRKSISEIRKTVVCTPLRKSSQECCTFVLKKLGRIRKN
uniref:Melanocortin 2 receptor accessory protein n=1 Tax=Falco tinnunculus TaxID=100819 RepID=A0A8C4TZE4_FALTI